MSCEIVMLAQAISSLDSIFHGQLTPKAFAG
jgi:hypothetical protein